MERVELIRDCEAVQIPAGDRTTLEKGIEVFITQSLGGTFTLQVPSHGGLFRIAGKDADALGKTPEQAAETQCKRRRPRSDGLGSAKDLLRPGNPR